MSSAREFDKEQYIPHTEQGAPRGMVKNAPHEDIPEGSVAYVRNAHCFPTEWQPRLAAIFYQASLNPPRLTGRSGYTASKAGYIITSLSGNIFTEEDVSNYFVWPGDPRWHDVIEEYLSPTTVRVKDSGNRDATTGCWMHAKMNLWEYHETQNTIFFQWGRRVYVSDDLTMTSLTEALCVSRHQPSNAISDWSSLRDWAVIGNSNGIFLVDFNRTVPQIFKKNTPVPSILISSNVRTIDHRHRYCYTYAMARLTSIGVRNRTSVGARILQESGTCALNPNTVPPRDYGDVWTVKSIDSGIRTQGRLIGAELAADQQTVDYYRELGSNGGSYQITINGVIGDFITIFDEHGYDVGSLADIAAAIQDTIKTLFSFATCDYDYDNIRFIFTSGEEDGSTIGYGGDGNGATEIGDLIGITAVAGAEINNSYAYAGPTENGWIYVPKVPDEPTIPEQHWTHYVIFRSVDIGPNGAIPRVGENGEALPPLKFHWVEDLRVAGAFMASKSRTGLVTIFAGQLQQQDEGTAFKWEDGEIDTIVRYIDSTHFSTYGEGQEEDYYENEKPLQAAAIGGGDVLRLSQSGNVVTRHGGHSFEADDVRKTITWSSGYYSVITEYINANSVRVDDTITKVEIGATIDPIARRFTDIVPDEILRDRAGEKHIGLLTSRFRVAMPNINLLEIVPGFMITGIRNDGDFYYCETETEREYLSGYYLELQQKNTKCQGAIQAIMKMPNKFILVCANALWGGPTNQPDVVELPEFGEAYSVLYCDIIDDTVGIVDIGSIARIGYGVYEARCTDNTWRQFNAFGFNKEIGDLSVDPQTGQDRVKRDLRELQARGVSLYGDIIGHVYWGST